MDELVSVDTFSLHFFVCRVGAVHFLQEVVSGYIEAIAAAAAALSTDLVIWLLFEQDCYFSRKTERRERGQFEDA